MASSLGLYSGAALGTLSSIIPCNQTLAGVRCVRTVATLGAGIGTMSGLALGLDDADAVWRAYGRAGIGLAAGSVFVLALKPFVDKWSWGDVGAGAVIGSSIAAGGSGAWVGLLVGTVFECGSDAIDEARWNDPASPQSEKPLDDDGQSGQRAQGNGYDDRAALDQEIPHRVYLHGGFGGCSALPQDRVGQRGSAPANRCRHHHWVSSFGGLTGRCL